MKRNALTLALFLTFIALAAAAAEPAAPSSMVCALGRVTICNLDGCKDGDIDALGVPGIIRLDLETGEMLAVTAADAGRRSTFRVLERKDGKITLQGFENGRAFSAVIDADGIASIATATAGRSIVMFGRCTDLALVNEGTKQEPAPKK
ncbi:MAG: hypothetical protein WC538_15565 [Thermoanaerobaculia bacterium]|jgi:hypothetical protein